MELDPSIPVEAGMQDLLPYINPEVIEAESLYDLIDEDMNYPDWD